MPINAKINAIPFKNVNSSFGYKISAAETGKIKDILFAIVVTATPTFCVPSA